MRPSYKKFADTVRNRRIELGLRQEDLAERSGLSLRAIQNYEAGNVLPRPSSFILLAATLSGDVELTKLYSDGHPPAGAETPVDPERV